jgi:hypothetical protein
MNWSDKSIHCIISRSYVYIVPRTLNVCHELSVFRYFDLNFNVISDTNIQRQSICYLAFVSRKKNVDIVHLKDLFLSLWEKSVIWS